MSNVAQSINPTRKPVDKVMFSNGSLAASTTGTLALNGVTSLSQKYIEDNASIYRLVATIGGTAGTLTSGTITFYPTINGTIQTAFTLVVGTGGAAGGVKSQDARKTKVKQGDVVGVLYNTATVAPAGIPVELDVMFLKENVDQ